MYLNILNTDQHGLLPLLKEFSPDFYLAGGTAVALQVGHRRSIDFDLFSSQPLNIDRIVNTIKRSGRRIEHSLAQTIDEFTSIIDSVKTTFLHYPFPVQCPNHVNGIIRMPDLTTLCAMKAYALGRRGKWKDYVDLYFLLKDHVSFPEVTQRAKNIFGNLFNEKLFREQLCYFEDLDFSEKVEYADASHKIDDDAIQKFLTELATREVGYKV